MDIEQMVLQLQKEVEELKKQTTESKESQAKNINKEFITKEFEKAEATGESNKIKISGSYGDISLGSIFKINLDIEKQLLTLDPEKVSTVLSLFSNKDRYAIFHSILNSPKTVAELVVELNLNSTGKVYHHINPLINADLVKNRNGLLTVNCRKMGGVLAILAGVYKLTKEKK